jgi:hypothetical protein
MAAIRCLVVLLPIINAVQVTIDNRVPRLDVNGKIVDAHDGSIQQFEAGGLYYMHAMQYGLCQEPPNYGCDGVSHRCMRYTNLSMNIRRPVRLKSADFNWITTSVSGLRVI